MAVDVFHHGLHVGHILFADGWLVVIVVVLEYLREKVAGGLTFGVAHCIDGGVGALGEQLVLQTVALAVASDDSAYLPEAEVVEKFAAGDAYLAHEQLVDVVGGG